VKHPERQDIKQALDFAKIKLVTTTLDHAETLASNPLALQKYLTSHQPDFVQPYDEYRWIKLLSVASNKSNQLLTAYRPRFHLNEILQIELAIKLLQTQGNETQARQYIDRISKELSGNPHALDHLSYQLIEQGSADLAIRLLLNTYPYTDADGSTRQSMLERLELAQAASKDKNSF